MPGDQTHSRASRDCLDFDALVREHYRSAYKFAHHITGNQAEAEDLVQESFLRAFRFFAKYDSNFPFQSWLFRIMLNTNVDLIRRKGRLKTTRLDAGHEGGNHEQLTMASPDRAMLQNTMDARLHNGLSALPTQFRTAVLLADVEGMSYEEIAAVMKTSVGTVRSRVHRGRKQLRKLITRPTPVLTASAALQSEL